LNKNLLAKTNAFSLGGEMATSASPAGKQSEEKIFSRGQQVLARYKGKDFYPGRISAVQILKKTYSIIYDDGDAEENVSVDLIFPRLTAGTRIKAAFKKGLKYYPGIIRQVNDNWNYVVDYDDGDSELSVSPEFVKTDVPLMSQGVSVSPMSTPSAKNMWQGNNGLLGKHQQDLGMAAILIANQNRQLSQQIYLSQQLAHSIRLQEKILLETRSNSARNSTGAQRNAESSGSTNQRDEVLCAQMPVIGPNGEETSAVAFVRLRVAHGQGNHGDIRNAAGAGNAGPGAGAPRVNLEPMLGNAQAINRLWRINVEGRRRRGNRVRIRRRWHLRQLALCFLFLVLIFGLIFQDMTLDYVDRFAYESAGYVKFESIHLWQTNVPSNEPKHLCFGMALYNENNFDVEVHAYHISDLKNPQHVTVLKAHEVLRLPEYRRRTAYEVFTTTSSNKRVSQRAGSGNAARQNKKHLYSILYDPIEHDSKALMTLSLHVAVVQQCIEFSNGQFRLESSSTPLQAYESLNDMSHYEEI
jgi:hypothetical protein